MKHRSIPGRNSWFRLADNSGFTLVEMMVAGGIGAFVLVGIMTTYIFSIKSFVALSNYVDIHGAGRKSVNLIARDMRGVCRVTSFTTNSLTVLIPTAFSATGSVISNKTVTYTLDGSALKRTDSSSSKTSTLAAHVTQLDFALYDHLGSNTTLLSSAKGIQVNIRLRKQAGNQSQTEDFLSARLDMRNIP